jgi:coenzyme F420-0:L-glutamate ligase/coenzyme F420-1:gamma-L-glutamate ligase
MPDNRVEAYPLKVHEPATVGTCAEKSFGDYIGDVLSANSLALEDRDVLVVASKLVSIFEGRIVWISGIKPSLKARLVGKAFGKDPKKVELVLGEGPVQGVIPMKQIYKIPSLWARLSVCSDHPKEMASFFNDYSATFMVKTNDILLDDAGIDVSNVPAGCAALLPIDANASAREIRRSVCEATGKEIAVIVTDTSGVLGKLGGQDIALGCAGLDPLSRDYASEDVFGNLEGGGIVLIADSLAALGGLLMGQGDEATPICLIRGFAYQPEKEEGGMKIVFYPRGVVLRSAVLVVFATVFYYLLHVLTLPFGSRKQN